MSNRLEVDYKATWTPGGFAATMAAATITPITPITNIEIADTLSMNDQPMPKALQAALRSAAAGPISQSPQGPSCYLARNWERRKRSSTEVSNSFGALSDTDVMFSPIEYDVESGDEGIDDFGFEETPASIREAETDRRSAEFQQNYEALKDGRIPL